jgi:hypothetical protein
MIKIIIIDVSRYLFVYFVCVCVFAVAANLLFFREDEMYQTFSRSMITMFEASIGNPDFSIFAWRKYTGWAFLTVWIFLSAVILMNLLIAVLSNRYDELSPQANADYASLMYIYYSSTRFTPIYGALVLFPPPWNAVLVPFVPLFFFKRTAEKAGFYLEHISYLLLLVFTLLLFTLLNLALVPYVYCKKLHFLANAPDIHRKSVQVLMWVVFGPGFLVILWAMSYKTLFKFLYDQRMPDRPDMQPLRQQIKQQLEAYCRASSATELSSKGECTSASTDSLSSMFCSDDEQVSQILYGITVNPNNVFGETLDDLHKSLKLTLLLKFRSSPSTVDLAFALECMKHWTWQQLLTADPYIVRECLGLL